MFSLFNFSSIFHGGQLTPFAPMCGRPCTRGTTHRWGAGSVKRYGVRLCVCPIMATCFRFAGVGPSGRRYRSLPQRRANTGSATFTYSSCRMLNTDLSKPSFRSSWVYSTRLTTRDAILTCAQKADVESAQSTARRLMSLHSAKHS